MKVTDEMVSRFLRWKLPNTFAPDCGISFRPIERHPDWTHDSWPVGTNLLTYSEARAMLEYVLSGADQPSAIHEYPEGEVSVVNPQGTEETGVDRPAAPNSQPTVAHAAIVALREIRDMSCGCDDDWTCPSCIARTALDATADNGSAG